MSRLSKMIRWLKNLFIRIKNACFVFFKVSPSDDAIADHSVELLNNKEFNRVQGASPYYYPVLKREQALDIKEEKAKKDRVGKLPRLSEDEPNLEVPRLHRMGSGLGLNERP